MPSSNMSSHLSQFEKLQNSDDLEAISATGVVLAAIMGLPWDHEDVTVYIYIYNCVYVNIYIYPPTVPFGRKTSIKRTNIAE